MLQSFIYVLSIGYFRCNALGNMKNVTVYATAYGPIEYIYHVLDTKDRELFSSTDPDAVLAHAIANHLRINPKSLRIL